MRGQVGYWGSSTTGGMCVGFSAEMVEWLDGHDVDRKVFVSVSKERKVILLPDATGGHVSGTGAAQTQGTPYRYVSSVTPDSLFLDMELPPFELHQVEFLEEEGCLSCELAEDHELPWPRLKLDCSTYEAEQLAVEALQWRLNALIASGQTSFKSHQRMPDRLRRLLPAGKWAECVAVAKALSGGMQ